jgi:regulator of PEP synthase PpsR (kinase-PPPase family)
MPDQRFHLHLVSDSTGETLNAIARATEVQFDGFEAIDHMHAMVRSEKQIEKLLDSISNQPGLVMFTLVNPSLRDRLEEGCRKLGVPYLAVLDPVLQTLGSYLGAEALGLPGQQHQMDADYFRRIEAMAYTMDHDDGIKTDDLHLADIVILGVSRTTKTPTGIYLANRGLKVANVPVVPGLPLPAEIEGLTRPLIVALTVSPDRLVQVRRNRLLAVAEGHESDYIEPETVTQEITDARKLFLKKGWPVIDVTRRSIEETAAAIYNLYQQREEERQQERIEDETGGETA